MRKILYGGSFDPIHLGHLHMAELAHQQLDADVIFVPAPISVWKKESAPIEDKIKMIELSIKDKPYFSIDLFEVNSQKETNYSIDTASHFVKEYPNDVFYYLIGADQVNEFHRWKKADELAKIVQIVYFERPNYPVDSGNVEKYHMKKISGDVKDVSSSDIREFKSLEVTDDVLDYILNNHLYVVKKVDTFFDDHRGNHSIEVAKLAYKIAKKHNLEHPEDALIAGLLHDIGKTIPETKQIMVDFYPEYKDLPLFAYHQFVGEYIAKTKFGVKNEEILAAIKFHATGNEKMGTLAKIVYAADKIEPTRKYDSSELIAAMMDKPIDEGFKIVLKANKEFLEMANKCTENPLTSKCFEYYL